MKSIGEVFSSFISENSDGRLIQKARGYAAFFSSWAAILEDNRLPVAAAHSRIAELERHLVLVEADHPGWIQILQTKQQEILEDLQRRFPALEIRGIALRYAAGSGTASERPAPRIDGPSAESSPAPEDPPVKPPVPLKDLKDPDFVDSLKRLKQGIIERERKGPRNPPP
jgi:hypothetical protein